MGEPPSRLQEGEKRQNKKRLRNKIRRKPNRKFTTTPIRTDDPNI